MEAFIEHINNVYPLPQHCLEKILALVEVENHTAGFKIVEQGKKTEDLFFSLEGICRAYITTNEGVEKSTFIFPENSFLGAITCLISEVIPYATIECVTNCKLARINYYKFIELTDTFIEINKLHRANLEKAYVNLEKRDFELANLNATERYVSLKKDIPQIDNILPQKKIASYLGITNVQLSRLKKLLYSL